MGPDPAVAAVRRAVRELLSTPPVINSALWSPGQPQRAVDQRGAGRVLVACSGGADSLALAAATAFVAPRLGIAAGLVTVDHGLQAGSSEQAARVVAIGYELGLDPVEIVPVEIGRAGGPEAAARAARYAALQSVASALDAHVLLGHTLDDQAETVLLGLGRGSGPRSIAGMRPVTAMSAATEESDRAPEPRLWLRPFLGLRRATTAAACAALGLAPWEDPHNADPAFRRVRLRREVLPLLEDVLAGGVAEALARTASLVQDDLDALDALATPLINSRLWSPGQPQPAVDDGRDPAIDHGRDPATQLDVTGLAGQPRAIRSRVLRAWAERVGAEPLTAAHVAALDALLTNWHGQGPVDLPGGRRAVRASGKLMTETLPVGPRPGTPPPAPAPPAGTEQSASTPPAQEQPRA